MRPRHRVARIAPAIPTASMADIAFLLLIFFMLTTSFSPERTNLQLPESEIRTEVSRDAAIIALTAEGEVFFTDGERPSFPVSGAGEVGTLAQEIIRLIPDKEFIIKADRAVRYQRIDAVLDQLRTSGVRRIGLLTERKVNQTL